MSNNKIDNTKQTQFKNNPNPKTQPTTKKTLNPKSIRLFYSTTLNDAPGMPQIGQRSEVWLISMFPQTGQR